MQTPPARSKTLSLFPSLPSSPTQQKQLVVGGGQVIVCVMGGGGEGMVTNWML
eukprot:NODE_9354_length_264_cov_14.395349_g8613_i0.p3 GENE.NODE_9354_length_264_cov_14.395349_g8613_i0~~NODE_9354_length_264_cov_14.395349_g8613_i0.p3  ORF type:complete len:53 (-),score=3.19 NODE_9354_length_264_cov_14.395349_g8613_i0:104-262(-)